MSDATRTVITGEGLHAPIGPYSVGIQTGDLIFLSGTLGTDPSTGEIAPGGIEAEARQALENISTALEVAGSNLQNVLKATVFLRDMDDFSRMNAVYAEFFPSDPPARSAVQVARLPRDAALEIEVIALRSS